MNVGIKIWRNQIPSVHAQVELWLAYSHLSLSKVKVEVEYHSHEMYSLRKRWYQTEYTHVC